MKQEANPQDYLWVITESGAGQETFLGFSDEDAGDFIPACSSKEECLMLIPLLPPVLEGERQVEAIHKERLKEKSSAEGFRVLLVDRSGTVLDKLS